MLQQNHSKRIQVGCWSKWFYIGSPEPEASVPRRTHISSPRLSPTSSEILLYYVSSSPLPVTMLVYADIIFSFNPFNSLELASLLSASLTHHQAPHVRRGSFYTYVTALDKRLQRCPPTIGRGHAPHRALVCGSSLNSRAKSENRGSHTL